MSINNSLSVKFEVDENNITLGTLIFGRNIGGFLITTAVPSIIANIIGHATNYFGDELFDAAIGVNLTILLVLSTM